MTERFIVKKDATLFEVYQMGLVKWLMDRGLVTIDRAIYFRYIEVFRVHRKSNNKTESVKLTADECGVTEKTIWKALREIGEK